MKALQYHLSQKQRKERNIDTNIKLVSAGIELCKIKTAALSYESLVAFLSFCGVDVGTIGHGRFDFKGFFCIAGVLSLISAVYLPTL